MRSEEKVEVALRSSGQDFVKPRALAQSKLEEEQAEVPAILASRETPSKNGDEPQEFKLVPFDCTAAEMKEVFTEYIKGVDESITKTFNCDIDNLIETANSGPDSCWLQIKSGDSLEGICVYNLDLTQYYVRRIMLLHFSVKNMQAFSTALREVQNYILMHDNCAEVRCCLSQTN